MSASTTPRKPPPQSGGPDDHSIRPGAWMALLAAFLGWMFDGLEIGLFPLVARPALTDLLGQSEAGLVGKWIGIMTAVFLVGAATGGVVFGWLGDRIGRVRAMTLSVLTYAIFMGLCGFAGNVWHFFLFRFIASLGMGGEWSLGVALVMEIWPNRSRAFMAGLIGAAANVGFLLIALVGLVLGRVIASTETGLLAAGLPQDWVTALVANSGWRLLMLFGAMPALLTFFIRLMVPESERWLHAKEQGATDNWATRDLLGVAIGACGPLTMIYLWTNDKFGMPLQITGSVVGLLIALAGYTYPVIRYLQRGQAGADGHLGPALGTTLRRMLLGACLSGVALLGTWASLQNAASWADKLVEVDKQAEPKVVQDAARSAARSQTQIVSAIGAILGTIAGALVGDLIGRRATYCLLCVASLMSSLAFFQLNDHFGPMFLVSVFLAGGLTASFYGWFPLYLPELFRTSVRATGQGFSFNFGRILAAVGALQFGILMAQVFDNDFSKACSVMSCVYLVGVVIIWFAPETKGKPLPD